MTLQVFLVVLCQVKIGTGRESVTLKRSRTATGYKEKEVITGTATFEAGKTYPITISGQSTRAGVQLSPSGSLLFDDNATNGFDINGELKLIRAVSYTHLTLPTNREV